MSATRIPLKHIAICFILAVTGANGATIRPGEVDVVVAPGAKPTVTFAAEEMTNFLSRVLGTEVPIRSAPAAGRMAVVLGDNDWCRAAGLTPQALARDAFQVKVSGDRIFIAGRDSGNDPRRVISAGVYARVNAGTLYGVYDFLESHAGCRFYFPGEIGTIVPRRKSIEVPSGSRTVKADFSVRYIYLSGDGEGFLSPPNERGNWPEKSLNWLRLRMETETTPCCHGLNGFNYPARFGASHPEYFSLDDKGNRPSKGGHLCYSSAITNVIYEDVKARLLGGARFVDVMPQDGIRICRCARCQAKLRPAGEKYRASELVWEYVAGVGNRLIAEKVPGFVTMMAYSQYRGIPNFDLPTNVLVMVAESGPWSKSNPAECARQKDEIRRWSEKLGRKVWVWTYPHKWGVAARTLKDVPQMSPVSWSEYYQDLAPWIFGSFAETESDKWIYNYLNYYVFSRIAWDNRVDVAAVLDEHFRLMFGAAADDMRRFYAMLEETWVGKIQGHVEETALGPSVSVPQPLALWREIYSPERIAACADCFRSAAAKVPRDSLAFRRLRFVKEQFYDPLARRAKAYRDGLSVERELARRKASAAVNLTAGAPVRWHTPGGKAPIRDLAVAVTSEGSFRLEQDYAFVAWEPALKPETTYRVSYFLRLDGVRKRADWKGANGGFLVEVHDGFDSTRYPTPYEVGTTDWIHRSFTFRTPTAEKMTKKPYVMPWMLHGEGVVRVDGLQVEKVESAR